MARTIVGKGRRGRSRSLRAERASLRAELAEIRRVKADLLGVVAHELRTPLTSILGYARTMERHLETLDRSALDQAVGAIDQQATRLQRIVDNLLTLAGEHPCAPDAMASAQAAAGDATLAPIVLEPAAATDLAPVTARVIAELAQIHGAAQTSRIHRECPPGSRIGVPAADLAAILRNLLDNALKFSLPDSTIHMAATRDGDQVVIQVWDRGAPLSEAASRQVFTPFVQGDSSTTRRGAGLGLGLAVVRRLASRCGGTVTARNEPPWVVLEVCLPAAPAVGSADDDAGSAAQDARRRHPTATAPQG